MDLYKEISKIELQTFTFHGFAANRRVASFGYDYSFEKGSLSKGKNIPPIFDFLIEKVSTHVSVKRDEFAELLVIEYLWDQLSTDIATLRRLI